MEFASEMVIKATIMGLKVTEVPTTLSPDGRSRPPHLRSWRDGWLHLKLLLTFAPNWLFYYPGMALLAVGTASSSRFLAARSRSRGDLRHRLADPRLRAGPDRVSARVLLCARPLHTVKAGLMPASPRFKRMAREISVDRACQVGGILLFAGSPQPWGAVVVWGRAGWGDLNPASSHARRLCGGHRRTGCAGDHVGFLWGLIGQRIEEPQMSAAEANRPALEV
jgi:hypothetical protein